MPIPRVNVGLERFIFPSGSRLCQRLQKARVLFLILHSRFKPVCSSLWLKSK